MQKPTPQRIGLWTAVFVLAGLGAGSAFGFIEGNRATENPIHGPYALAIDPTSQYLFVASFYENNVRRINLQNGTMKIVAGNGRACCYQDGMNAADVSLDSVRSLAVNSAGDLFLSEGKQVRKVDAKTEAISTFAGNGEFDAGAEGLPAAAASFGMVMGLAFDARGNLFLADQSQESIFEIDRASGVVSRVAGNGKSGAAGDGGSAREASFFLLGSIALDANGNLLIADQGNCRVRRMDAATGIIETLFVTEIPHACWEETQNHWVRPSPSDLAVDSSGDLFFNETAMDLVMRARGHSSKFKVSMVAGDAPGGFSGDDHPAIAASLSRPSGLAIDAAGDIFISDLRNNRVRRIDARTKIIRTIAGNGTPRPAHTEY